MEPDADLLAPQVERNVSQVDGDIDGGYRHENIQNATGCNEVIDHPGPDPSDAALQSSNGDHNFDRKLKHPLVEIPKDLCNEKPQS